MPIKEKILKEIQEGPKKYKKLQAKFKASKKFFMAMEELYNEGKIVERNGYIHLVVPKEKKRNADPSLLAGTVVKLTENFGFVRVPEMEIDVFVSGKYLMGAVPGDEVLMKKVRSVRRDIEGEIVEITKEKTNIIAVVTRVGREISLQLKDCRYVNIKAVNKAPVVEDDIVIINLNNRGTNHSRLTATITEVVGKVSSSEKAVQVLLAEKNLDTEFTQQVINDANKVIDKIDIEEEIAKRTDLRHMPIFTIDSASTKDIDDAICIERTDSGYRLGVHIADVSFCVRGGSDTDNEAFNRGTSVYFGNSVIPMLPKEYSNDVCSLNENSTRLAFSCIMELDSAVNITDYRFEKTVIRSRVKGVYSEINSILAGQETDELKEKYSRVYGQLAIADELFTLLRRKRVQRGSMDIESDEAYIIFDEKGKAVDITKRERGQSEMIIEEFMLLANSCSANLAKKMKLPFVYRIHQQPDAEKLITLKENLGRLGLSFSYGENKSMQQAMSDLLDETRGTTLETTAHKMILRSQSKAKYSPDPVGHFGIVLDDYAHFTSPIRRYSDLAIHRILSDFVAGKNHEAIAKRYSRFSQARSQQASVRELVAMQTERDATDIYKAEIMENHIGEVFTGTVSGVANYGIYVTLENTVEGLVHISMLDMFNPVLTEGYSLYCPISGEEYKIGDVIDVKVTGTDILNGNVDFAPADVEINVPKKKPEKRKEKSRVSHKKEPDRNKKRTKLKHRRKR
ncbi:MAG: VacB/RNase II family 3'-5' exoribonuclease [Oscillospiraceae bacterium]|nr:VacB/RNase II family 3'-5' exoribonuclease [Oscillospiraceae bacterium]